MVKLLTSYRFALAGVVALLATTVAAAVILPEGSPAGIAPWYIGLAAIVGLSMGICTWQRAAREIRALLSSPREGMHAPVAVQRRVAIDLSGRVSEGRLNEALRRTGWGKGRKTPDGSSVYERGKTGVWGSIVFHFGMIVTLAGIGTSLLFGVRGMFALTEGESFPGGVSAMRNPEIGMLGDTSLAAQLKVSMLRFDRRYRVGGSTTTAAELNILDDTLETSAVVFANNGFTAGPGVLHLADKWGFSPAVVIEDTVGDILFMGVVRLATQVGKGDVRFLDRIDIPGGRSLEVEFFPALRMAEGRAGSEGTDLKNPYILLTLSERGSVLVREYLGLNQSVRREGIVLAFPAVRHWAQFEFVHDPGTGTIYTGFAIAFVGLAARLLFVRKKLVVSSVPAPGGTAVTIAAWSEKERHALSEELEAVSHHLREDLAGTPDFRGDAEKESLALTPQECN